MEDGKRKIIVKEIEHWRRSRLLPEHYCDFLMNLYLEEGMEKPKSLMGVPADSIARSNWKIWLLIMAIIGIFSFSALNFNSFGIPLQIGVSVLVGLIGYTLGFRRRKGAPLIANLVCGITSLFILFIGLYIMDGQQIDSSSAYVTFIASCSLIWLLCGLFGKIGSLHFSGWIGLMGTYGWMLVHKLQSPIWWSLELTWLPVSLLFVWIAWLVHHKSKENSGILFLVGFLTLFAPEGISFLTSVGVTMQIIQFSFMCKLVAAGIVLFLLRKKWIEWVI
ncbi:hypothetical protein [Paenibacillus eucommiae]|uniref:DUF2157 domain-containing protein n=1 Tax=Paenibacillus eucommiae TaxID=1355755 RepID=A0ABS4IZ26_9BACL|nr:hypothetical protein [Paenibacillus eucommiae]MBP1992838.1 hypothetical protein [Paenibacillus eucommiae]